jgi:hypothetical protein
MLSKSRVTWRVNESLKLLTDIVNMWIIEKNYCPESQKEPWDSQKCNTLPVKNIFVMGVRKEGSVKLYRTARYPVLVCTVQDSI